MEGREGMDFGNVVRGVKKATRTLLLALCIALTVCAAGASAGQSGSVATQLPVSQADADALAEQHLGLVHASVGGGYYYSVYRFLGFEQPEGGDTCVFRYEYWTEYPYMIDNGTFDVTYTFREGRAPVPVCTSTPDEHWFIEGDWSYFGSQELLLRIEGFSPHAMSCAYNYVDKDSASPSDSHTFAGIKEIMGYDEVEYEYGGSRYDPSFCLRLDDGASRFGPAVYIHREDGLVLNPKWGFVGRLVCEVPGPRPEAVSRPAWVTGVADDAKAKAETDEALWQVTQADADALAAERLKPTYSYANRDYNFSAYRFLNDEYLAGEHTRVFHYEYWMEYPFMIDNGVLHVSFVLQEDNRVIPVCTFSPNEHWFVTGTWRYVHSTYNRYTELRLFVDAFENQTMTFTCNYGYLDNDDDIREAFSFEGDKEAIAYNIISYQDWVDPSYYVLLSDDDAQTGAAVCINRDEGLQLESGYGLFVAVACENPGPRPDSMPRPAWTTGESSDAPDANPVRPPDRPTGPTDKPFYQTIEEAYGVGCPLYDPNIKSGDAIQPFPDTYPNVRITYYAQSKGSSKKNERFKSEFWPENLPNGSGDGCTLCMTMMSLTALTSTEGYTAWPAPKDYLTKISKNIKVQQSDAKLIVERELGWEVEYLLVHKRDADNEELPADVFGDAPARWKKLDDALLLYLNDPERYTPPVVRIYAHNMNNTHSVLVIGKLDENTYRIMDSSAICVGYLRKATSAKTEDNTRLRNQSVHGIKTSVYVSSLFSIYHYASDKIAQ